MATGVTLASAAVRFGDNVKWSADGKTLLVASFIDSDPLGGLARCAASKGAGCRIHFAIVELDPDTLSQRILFANPDAPMTAGTVGLKVDQTLFIGSFSGDRILEVALENPSTMLNPGPHGHARPTLSRHPLGTARSDEVAAFPPVVH